MKYLPILSELTDLEIIDAARATGEPEWLIERRAEAWRFFAESTPPFWKRTDLSKFSSEDIAAPLGVQGTASLSSNTWARRLLRSRTSLLHCTRRSGKMAHSYMSHRMFRSKCRCMRFLHSPMAAAQPSRTI